MDENEKREKLLLKMYDQMFNDIDCHIKVIWQSISVVIGAFAVFALAEKNIISIDICASLVLLLCSWLIAHLYDAAYWYNRDLVIIANIERVFLRQSDLKEIHYYFGKHRPNNKMITHMSIQYFLGIGISVIIICFHFIERVAPGIGLPWSNFEPIVSLPYIILLAAIIAIGYLRNQRNKSYKEFLENSPGIEIDTKNIKYGVGHGFTSK